MKCLISAEQLYRCAMGVGIAGAIGIFSSSDNVYANDSDWMYYSIGNPEITEITGTDQDRGYQRQPIVEYPVKSDHSQYFYKEGSPNDSSSDNSIWSQFDLTKIINWGEKAWAIISAGKPVVNVELTTANALPSGPYDWQAFEGWKAPVSKVFHMSYKNLWGSEVIGFNYRLLYTYGGSVKGKGAYLNNISVVPSDLHVAWNFKFNAKVQIPSVTNAGTTENPIAGAEILVSWTVDTVLKHQENSATYYIKGDGTFQDLSDGANSDDLLRVDSAL